LLNDYKEISKEDIRMIKKAYDEKGVVVAIATGRPPIQAEKLSLLNDNFANYIISCNGAVIYNIKTNGYIYKDEFSSEEVLQIRKIFLEEKADYMMMATEKEYVSEFANRENLQKFRAVAKKINLNFDNIEETIKENPSIEKFACVIGMKKESEHYLKRIVKRLEEYPMIKASLICKFAYKIQGDVLETRYIDISKTGNTKKSALNILAKELRIDPKEIMVIGDSGNDMPMFEMAGLKVAMANAEDYLKERADYITASNNESGVAATINRFIFNMEEERKEC